jgi:hypothetical protein
VADALRQAAGARVVIDSSKDAVSMVDLYAANQGRMKVIFLTRDVRANVWSQVKTGSSVQAAVRTWNRVNRTTLQCLDNIARADWVQVKYEELCANPDKVVRRLWAFVGRNGAADVQETRAKSWHTIGGNKIRKSSVKEIREDLTWRANLSANDIKTIESTAKSTCRLLGY